MPVETKTCRACGKSFSKPSRIAWLQWEKRTCCSASCGNVRNFAEAFWARVQKSASGGCWAWIGAKNAKGYGNFRSRSAHVVSYEMANGPAPNGHEIDHLCRNRACVNPAHLEAVTHQENVRRAREATQHGV